MVFSGPGKACFFPFFIARFSTLKHVCRFQSRRLNCARSLCNAREKSEPVHSLREINPKPDISLAAKSGHSNLLRAQEQLRTRVCLSTHSGSHCWVRLIVEHSRASLLNEFSIAHLILGPEGLLGFAITPALFCNQVFRLSQALGSERM